MFQVFQNGGILRKIWYIRTIYIPGIFRLIILILQQNGIFRKILHLMVLQIPILIRFIIFTDLHVNMSSLCLQHIMPILNLHHVQEQNHICSPHKYMFWGGLPVQSITTFFPTNLPYLGLQPFPQLLYISTCK